MTTQSDAPASRQSSQAAQAETSAPSAEGAPPATLAFSPTDLASIQRTLIDWYGQHGRPLPWRTQPQSPWAILVCEVMSQQTPLSRVIPTWEAWMRTWPEPSDLALASPAEVIVAWERMGYPRRALRLRECAQQIVTQHGGSLPTSREELLALPGVGPYTADAVLAFGFHTRSVVLDTNIRRVLGRWNGIALPPATATRSERERAESFVPLVDEDAWRWNESIMELGEIVCRAKNPACEECPAASWCEWKKAGYPDNGGARRAQPWNGTMRQARGAIMGVLRQASPQPVEVNQLRAQSKIDQARFDAALRSLLADGLAQQQEDSGLVGLPTV